MLLNEDGAVFKTATEWLQWRDQMAFLMTSRPDLHAEVVGLVAKRMSFQNRVALIQAMADRIRRSEIVIWEEDKWKAATNGAASWVGAPTPDVPSGTPAQLWTFPVDYHVTEEQREALDLEYGYDLTAAFIMPVELADEKELSKWYLISGVPPGDWHGQPGWTVTLIFAPDQKNILSKLTREGLSKNPLPIAYRIRPFPAVDSGSPILGLYSEFFAAQQFMNMEFIQLEKVETTRQQRRQYERQHPDRSGSVQIVTLRRVSREKGEGESREVERHCQWLVRGHWRRRSKRWNSSDAPIWVRPHRKGPDGMPMKPVLDRIINVRR